MGDADRGPQVTDREILAVFAEADEEVFHDEDVADELPISNELLVDRLDDLQERGLVETADEDLPGERWRLTPTGEDEADVPESEVETELEAQTTKTTGTETPPHEEETPESPPPDPQEDHLGSPPLDQEVSDAPPSGELPESVSDDIEAFDPPGTPRQKARRRIVLRRAYAYPGKRGVATREDFVNDVFSTAPAGYEGPDEWWTELVRPGLATMTDVERDDDEWRFVGEGLDQPSG